MQTETRPDHPLYGKPLSGATITHAGIPFYPYRQGILGYIRVSHDQRIAIYEDGRTGTIYRCSVDGNPLPKSFRKFATAVRAALAAMT